VSKRSLAAHDVRAKLMHSLSNSDDDDDDLPVRAAMLLAERRQREDLLLKAYGNTRVNWILATFQATGKVFR
jgi:hypothetical protein